MLVHWCDACHYNTPVPHTATVWAQEHTCSHCGLASPGADLAGRSSADMAPAQHDELAELFAQSMQLSSTAPSQYEPTPSAHIIESVSLVTEKQAKVPLHFVSTHYTGMAYVRPDTTSEPSRSPPPPYHEALMPEAMADMLRRNAIDPSALLPNQVHLFQNADHEQRLRLLELWRIAPPAYPLEDNLSSTWSTTSVEREEALAKVRFERSQVHNFIPPAEEYMLDTHIVEPISPIREAGEPAFPPAARMRAASIASSRPATRHSEAEPYIVNIYAADQAAKSVGPVYAAAPGMWQVPYATSGNMEDQYGMYEQIRNHADWERMNERIARERMAVAMQGSMDDDMIL